MEARESLVLDAYQSVSECKRVCLKDEVRSDVRKSTVACEPCCPPWINAAGGALGATIPQAWTRADPMHKESTHAVPHAMSLQYVASAYE